MKSNFSYTFLFILNLIVLNSCATRESIAYFQDEKMGSFVQPELIYDLFYQPNDILTIDVNALDPEAVRPFNLTSVPYGESLINETTSRRMQTYIVDSNGNIEFPVLGSIKIGGLTRREATNLLKEKLTKYVKDPLINIRITNFTVTVLGEVSRPGSFIIQDEKVTLAEVLGLAGDLTIYGKRNNILLIREINGNKQFSILDLTSVRTLTSSTYNLKQNDVIYVEPNKTKIRNSTYNPNNNIIISAVGTLTSVAALIVLINSTKD